MLSSGSQASSRPPPKPKVLKPIDSKATLPARIMRSGHESFRPYFCLIGHSSRRALSRLAFSGQLVTGPGAAAAVADAIAAGEMPRHPNEQPSVMAIIRRPPILRVPHQGVQILDHGIQIEALEFLGVVELLTHRIGQSGVLMENL